MGNELKKLTYEDMAKNPDLFEFKCSSIVMKPKLDIYLKETGKLINSIAAMDVVIFEGSMDQEYADKFFKSMTEETKTAFLNHISRNMNKEKPNGTEERDIQQ